jgi:hypothetical protein
MQLSPQFRQKLRERVSSRRLRALYIQQEVYISFDIQASLQSQAVAPRLMSRATRSSSRGSHHEPIIALRYSNSSPFSLTTQAAWVSRHLINGVSWAYLLHLCRNLFAKLACGARQIARCSNIVTTWTCCCFESLSWQNNYCSSGGPGIWEIRKNIRKVGFNNKSEVDRDLILPSNYCWLIIYTWFIGVIHVDWLF